MKWCTNWVMYEEEKGKACTKRDLEDDLYYGRLSRSEYDALTLQVPKKIRKPRGKQLCPCSAERRKEIREVEMRQEARIRRQELLRRSKDVREEAL